MARRKEKWNQPAPMARELSAGAKAGIAAAIVFAVLGIAAVVAFVFGWLPWPPFGGEDPGATEPVLQENADTVIHFVAGGDVIVTDDVVKSGLNGSGYDYGNVFLDVMPVLSGADLTVLNLEGNLYGNTYGSKTSCAPQELAQALRNAGVDIVQTANSKSITNGTLGLAATLDGIRQAGMQPVGSYASEEEFRRYEGFLIREVNGVRIAITAFTKGMEESKGIPSGCYVNLLYKDFTTAYQKVDEDGIRSVLKKIAAEKPDITIALLHWGSEYNDQISKTQKKIVSIMADGGVDAIIGTHPHYVQSIGFDPDTGMLIAYSLGDLYGGEKKDTNYSVILDLEITKDGKTGKVSISDYSYTPVYCYKDPDGDMRILRIREAIAAYENLCIDAVSQEVYENMKIALARIEARVEK